MAGQYQPNRMRFMISPTLIALFAEDREANHFLRVFPIILKGPRLHQSA
jgi:hypothetical protein